MGPWGWGLLMLNQKYIDLDIQINTETKSV